MQATTALPPPHRINDLSPNSTGGSDWSGMNGYSGGYRPEASYNMIQRSDSATPPDPFGSNGPPPPFRANTFGASPSPTESRPRRPSEAGSRASSRAGSTAHSRSSDGTISDQQSRKYMRMEIELKQHYKVLQTYLRGGAPQPPRPNKARDKLLRLSQVQFHELSTDVFDELQRRQAAAPLPGKPPRQERVPPYLQPRSNFHEKRNQARQKLSSLQTVRFRDLSTDVFCELERRFPHFAGDGNRRDSSSSQSRGPGGRPSMAGLPSGANGFGPPPRAHTTNGSMSQTQNGSYARSGSLPGGVPHFDNPPSGPAIEYGRPMPKQFQSNTITPNKSIMVEDDEDDEYQMNGRASEFSRSSDAFALESSLTSSHSNRDTSATSLTGGSRDVKITVRSDEMQQKVIELEGKLKVRDVEIQDLMVGVRLRDTLEQKLHDAERLNQSMHEELERLHSEHASVERDLRTQLGAAKEHQDGGEWKSKHEQLERQHHGLQTQFAEQRRITEEVRQQGSQFLKEMRTMAESNGGSMEREEKLHTEVHKLQEELQEWKARYAKAKTQLRNVRTSSLGLNMMRNDVIRHATEDKFHQPDGMVKDFHITKFQIAIDELLSIARSDGPSAVLDHMKPVILAVRGITGDVEEARPIGKDGEKAKQIARATDKVAATANNLITASKNHAGAEGLSPVSLVDAAASHLTAAVVDLIQVVKIRPTPPEDLEHYDDMEEETIVDGGYFNVAKILRRRSAADSVYSALSDPPGHGEHDRSTPQHVNGYTGSSGLGIQPTTGFTHEVAKLEKLKVDLGQRATLLAGTVNEVVLNYGKETDLLELHRKVSSVTNRVGEFLGKVQTATHDSSSYCASLNAAVSDPISVVTYYKAGLEAASSQLQASKDLRSGQEVVQSLLSLAFSVAAAINKVVSALESVRVGHDVDEDFS